MDKKILFQVPAWMTKIETMSNGSLKLRIDTQEELDSEQAKILMDLREKFGWVTFQHTKGKEGVEQEMIDPELIAKLPPLNETVEFKNQKTSSERLRNVLYVYFTKKGGKETDFEDWRKKEMEKIIGKYKGAIPE